MEASRERKAKLQTNQGSTNNTLAEKFDQFKQLIISQNPKDQFNGAHELGNLLKLQVQVFICNTCANRNDH
jgi:hypothetical protein